ncbi:amidohydrolase [Actinomyces sp. 2119]|uniref:amidohydrolase n=1 Tax=Actinomyces sp. 2119 TaxID=2321393 RepID=UPI000E6B5314|nr:amidohydrolase family protein [Actinomyces sp. 2119]RJF44831.1 amidohydrolase [Actinomyces sp. 2119]
MPDLLIRNARIVAFRSRPVLAALRARAPRPFHSPAAEPRPGPPQPPGATGAASAQTRPDKGAPVTDIRVTAGRVTQVGPGLPYHGEQVLDVQGAYVIPGLWDAHVHLDLEAARRARIDTSATTCAQDALALVAQALRKHPREHPPASVQGFGHRLSLWPRVPTVAELDAVCGDVPVVLVSGDAHSGWLSSAALRHLGLPGATTSDPGSPLTEDAWFSVMDRLDLIPATRQLRESGYRQVLDNLLRQGVTGVVDMSWAPSPQDWPLRLAAMAEAGATTTLGDGTSALVPRIRTAVYRDRLDQWIAAGLRTGQGLEGSPVGEDGAPLLTQGPLKVIADGSMGTASAHVHDPYPESLGLSHTHGVVNIDREELSALMTRAARAGFDMAVHAIGDAAVDEVAAAFAASGARGRLEHAQLLPRDAAQAGTGALASLVACGVELSVQPAHLLDDWQAVERVWPGRRQRVYAFADMVGAGALLHLGSDAPVAPLDPWLAMSVAVGRSTPDHQVWSPDQRLTTEEALAASVDGQGPVRPGSRADLVVLEKDPLRLGADALAAVRPLSTVVAGRVLAL